MNLRHLTSMLAICVSFIAGQATAGSPPREMGNDLTWIQKPGPGEIDALYPQGARDRNLGGWALMRCRADAQGRMQDCKIAAEAPIGAGFGAMALKLSKRFQTAPTTTDGVSVEGGYVTIPVTLTGNGSAVIPEKTYMPAQPSVMLTAPKTADGKPNPQPCSTLDLSQGRCGMHKFKWRETIDLWRVASISRRAAQTSGKTALTCIVGNTGGLQDCTIVGEAAPGSRLAMQEIAALLHAEPKTEDGLKMEGQKVLALFDWAAMAMAYNAIFPPDATP